MIRRSWLNSCVGVAGLSGLFILSAISQAEVITWDRTSSPLSQGWTAGDLDSATISFQDGVVTVDTSPSTTGTAGLMRQIGGFDDYVFEFSIKLNSYSSTNLNDCWLEPMVSTTSNGNVHQFRPQLCSSGVNSEVINNTSNGTGATPFSVAVDPHETAFHIYRYEGNITQSTYSFYLDGELKSTGGMLVRPSQYSTLYTHFFSVGEGSGTSSANFDLNGMCIATGGDDCSLSTTPVVTYSVSATAGTGGSASCLETSVESGGSTTCTATADSGYQFDSWTGACAGQGAICSLNNITSDQTSAASFIADPSTDNRATPVPSLPFYMLALLSGFLGLFGLRSIRR
jgi:hypothetical protein